MVLDGQVIARSHNAVEATSQPTAHAEMLCIQAAASLTGRWRLPEATLYVTLEPCPMCAGAALQARLGTLVFGASNPLLGERLHQWLARHAQNVRRICDIALRHRSGRKLGVLVAAGERRRGDSTIAGWAAPISSSHAGQEHGLCRAVHIAKTLVARMFT